MTTDAGPQPVLTVYSRPGCHLCEVLIERLLPLARGRAEVNVVKIDSRAEWRERYDTRVPVVACDGVDLCQYELDESAIRRVLGL